jgi:hypothetical protein
VRSGKHCLEMTIFSTLDSLFEVRSVSSEEKQGDHNDLPTVSHRDFEQGKPETRSKLQTSVSEAQEEVFERDAVLMARFLSPDGW